MGAPMPCALLMWMLGLLVACTSNDPDLPQPSVLLITLDTVRADRIGAYGYAQAATPTLDRLAAEGTLFERAYSSSPMGLPALSTILTGLYPPSHGVRDGVDFRLDDLHTTTAELLQGAGWRTAAFTSAFTTRQRWGLDQGYSVYHDPLPWRPTRLDWRDQRRADQVVDDVLTTLPSLDGDSPVHVWVHLFDPHWPYDAPEPWATEHLALPYDGEIAFVDAQLGRLVEAWDARFGDASVVVVTAGHGESLGDAGESTHGYLLHDSTLRVPLILRGQRIDVGARVEDPVSLVDLLPTVLELCELEVPDDLPGRGLRTGGSEVAYHESVAGQFTLGLAPLYGYTDARGRYTEGTWGAWYPALDLRVSIVGTREDLDGGRGRDLAALREGMPERFGEPATLDVGALDLLSALGYLTGGDPEAPPGDIDPRDVIGTIAATGRARTLIGAGLHVRAQAELAEIDSKLPETFAADLLRARLSRRQGEVYATMEVFGDLYIRAPGPTTALQLAGLHESVGDWAEASSWYDQSYSHAPNSPEALAGRARSALQLGDLGLAESLTAELQAARPDHSQVELLEAELWLADSQPQAALEACEAALLRLPFSPRAHQVHGEALWSLGRSDAAIESLREALRLDPFQAAARARLAEVLLEVGRNSDAVRIAAPLSRMLPDDPEVVELYERAKSALTIDQRHSIRRDRALGPAGGRR